MSILSFFNQVLSGQRSKARIIDGFEVSYRFSGKPILFDPINMLRELRYRVEKEESVAGELCVEIGQIEESGLILNEKLTPTIVAKLKIGNDFLKVERFVKTFETVPCSRYDFSINQLPLCTFQRMYDYGKNFAQAKEKLAPFNHPGEMNQTNYWKNNQNEGLFLEHFGHTQLWMIYSITDLQKVWKELGT